MLHPSSEIPGAQSKPVYICDERMMRIRKAKNLSEKKELSRRLTLPLMNQRGSDFFLQRDRGKLIYNLIMQLQRER